MRTFENGCQRRNRHIFSDVVFVARQKGAYKCGVLASGCRAENPKRLLHNGGLPIVEVANKWGGVGSILDIFCMRWLCRPPPPPGWWPWWQWIRTQQNMWATTPWSGYQGSSRPPPSPHIPPRFQPATDPRHIPTVPIPVPLPSAIGRVPSLHPPSGFPHRAVRRCFQFSPREGPTIARRRSPEDLSKGMGFRHPKQNKPGNSGEVKRVV